MPSVNLFMLVGCFLILIGGLLRIFLWEKKPNEEEGIFLGALFITGVLFNLIGFASNHFV